MIKKGFKHQTHVTNLTKRWKTKRWRVRFTLKGGNVTDMKMLPRAFCHTFIILSADAYHIKKFGVRFADWRWLSCSVFLRFPRNFFLSRNASFVNFRRLSSRIKNNKLWKRKIDFALIGQLFMKLVVSIMHYNYVCYLIFSDD